MKFNIPGLHNSDEGHWQSILEKSDPDGFKRVIQDNWDEPDCTAWINRIEEVLNGFDYSELILIGHSIGCIAILKWFEKFGHRIKGALLVAPSDAEREGYPKYIRGFAPIPSSELPFPTILVASDDDHVTDLARSKEFAKNWGSKLIVLDKAGHIETGSGYGKWPLGIQLINELEGSL